MSKEMGDLMTWRQRPGGRTCRDGAKLEGQTMTFGYWLAVMTPGNTAAECEGECDCVLEDAASGAEETDNPYVVAGSASLQSEQPPLEINTDNSRLRKLVEEIEADPLGAVDPENIDMQLYEKNLRKVRND